MTAYEQLAADIGGNCKDYMPRDWARRGRVPVEWIDAVVNAAQRRGFHEITHAFVLKLITTEGASV